MDFADTQSRLSSRLSSPSPESLQSSAISTHSISKGKKRKLYLTADRTVMATSASALSFGEGSNDGGGSRSQRRRGKEGEKEVFYGRIKRAYNKQS